MLKVGHKKMLDSRNPSPRAHDLDYIATSHCGENIILQQLYVTTGLFSIYNNLAFVYTFREFMMLYWMRLYM